jgi:hypothetical protein
MARIPGAEGFGDVVAQPTPYVDTSPSARGAGLGQAAFNIGSQMQQQRNAEERQAAAARDAADRAQALDALNYTQDHLTNDRVDLVEGIRTGAVDKREATKEWERRYADRINGALDGVPPEHRATVRRGLDHRASVLGRDVALAVLQRDQSDTATGINSTLEYAQRLYRSDPIQAEGLVSGSLVELGPAAGWSSEEIGKKRQAWRESAQFATAYEAVSAGRDSPKALADAEEVVKRMDALDPKKRAELLDRASMFRLTQENRADAAARRAEADAERRLRVAEHSFNAFQAQADKGTALDPNYFDETLTAVAGTPYEAAVRSTFQQARETGGLASRSVAELDGAIQGIDTLIAQQGRNPQLDRRREQVAKVRDGILADAKEDPFGAALARGRLTGIAQIDLSSPQNMAATMGERMKQTEVVSQWLGRPVSPLRDAELRQLTDTLVLADPKGQAEALAGLSSQLTPDTVGAVADQLSKQNNAFGIALKVGAGRTSAGRQVSELVLLGAQALKDKTVQKDETALAGWRAQLAELTRGAIGSDEAETEVMDAAYYVMAAQNLDAAKAPGFGGGFGRGAKDAISMVAGRPLSRGGTKTLLPRGMTESQFDDAMFSAAKAQVKDLTPTGKVYLRGNEMDFETQVLPNLHVAGLQRDQSGRFIPVSRGAMFTLDPGGTLPLAIRVP